MKKTYPLLVCLLAAELILAIYCGPHSCDWGNAVYLYTGVFSMVLSFSLPFFRKDWAVPKRWGFGLLFLLASAVVWVVGFIAGGFSIICRMF